MSLDTETKEVKVKKLRKSYADRKREMEELKRKWFGTKATFVRWDQVPRDGEYLRELLRKGFYSGKTPRDDNTNTELSFLIDDVFADIEQESGFHSHASIDELEARCLERWGAPVMRRMQMLFLGYLATIALADEQVKQDAIKAIQDWWCYSIAITPDC